MRPLAAALLLLAACGSDDRTCRERRLDVREPSPGAVLADDVDPEAAGFQVEVVLDTDLPDGTPLEIAAGVARATARVKAGRAAARLTLPEGRSELRVSGEGCDTRLSARRDVVVARSGCAFVAPASGAELDASVDRDPDVAGVQLDVVAACRDGAPGDAAQLRIDGAPVASAAFDEQGHATFPSVSLHLGSPELQLARNEEVRATAVVAVTGPERCGVTLAPAPGAMFNLDGDVGSFPVTLGDADPERPGLQAGIEVSTDCEGATLARMSDLDGDDLGLARLAQGRGTVPVTPAAGPFSVFPSVEIDGAIVRGNPAGYLADPVRPACTLLAPVDGGLALDEDLSTAAVDFTVRGACAGIEEGATVEVALSTTPGSVSGVADATGAFASRATTPPGDVEVVASASRASGNRGTSRPVVFTAGEATCEIVSPADGSVTAALELPVEIASNLNPGETIRVSVEDPSGAVAELQLPAAKASGAGTRASGAFTLPGIDGIHRVRATCGPAEAAPAEVELDRAPPRLQVRLPAKVINLAVADAIAGGGFDLAVEVEADRIQDGSSGLVSMSCSPGGGAAEVPLAFAADAGTALVAMGPAREGDECTFTVTASDAAGNEAAPAEISAPYDRTAPSLLTSYPVVDFQLVARGNPRIDRVTVIENEGGETSPRVSLMFQSPGAIGGTVRIDEDAAGIHVEAAVDGEGRAHFPGVELPQGVTTTLSVTLSDAAGNATLGRRSATVDVMPPDAIVDLAVEVTDRRSATASLHFTAPAGDRDTDVAAFGYQVRWSAGPIEDDAAFDDSRVSQEVRFVRRPAAPGESETIEIGLAPLGEKHVCVRGVDRVGNRGPLACGSGSTAWDAVHVQAPAGSGAFAAFVVPLGDVTGDDVSDLAVADPRLVVGGARVGGVHLYAGGSPLAASLSAPVATLPGSEDGEACGSHVARGDFDGDGTGDLVVGCPGFDAGRGRILLFFGGEGAGLDPGASVEVEGILAGAAFGTSVASIGDIDAGRSADELWVSAPDDLETAGGGTILSGRSRFAWASATPEDGAAITVPGEVKGDRFGFRHGASTLGDLDGDGRDELVLPASGRNRVYYFRGLTAARARGGEMTTLADAIKVPVREEAAPGTGEGSLFDGFGTQAIGGRDFDLDVRRFPDLIVSDPHGGRVSLMRGDPLAKAMGTTPAQELSWKEPVSFGVSIAAGDATGDGREDLLVGSDVGAFLHRATGAGGASPWETAGGRQVGEGAGGSVAMVDLDGDGRLEVLVGAPGDAEGSLVVLQAP